MSSTVLPFILLPLIFNSSQTGLSLRLYSRANQDSLWTPICLDSAQSISLGGKAYPSLILDLANAEVKDATGKLGSLGKQINVSGKVPGTDVEETVTLEVYDSFPNSRSAVHPSSKCRHVGYHNRFRQPATPLFCQPTKLIRPAESTLDFPGLQPEVGKR